MKERWKKRERGGGVRGKDREGKRDKERQT